MVRRLLLHGPKLLEVNSIFDVYSLLHELWCLQKKKRLSVKKTPRPVPIGAVDSTGHAESPATIVIGRQNRKSRPSTGSLSIQVSCFMLYLYVSVCGHQLFHFSMYPSDTPTSVIDPSAVLHLQLGILCLLLSSTVTLSLFKARLTTHLFNTAYS